MKEEGSGVEGRREGTASKNKTERGRQRKREGERTRKDRVRNVYVDLLHSVPRSWEAGPVSDSFQGTKA